LAENISNLSIRSRCSLLSMSRNVIYYKPVANKNEVLEELILQIWLDRNNKGWRTIKADLTEYHQQIVNHKRVRRIMKRLGIRGILPKTNTSKSNKAHYKYPYGLKNLSIIRANMAWCSDITYIKLPQGFVYLVAIVDIYSRMILDYEISNTLEAEFCIRCLERCIQKYGKPAIFNTDQGVQYTSDMWLKVLNDNAVLVSMDGKGRWADNVWIERIWRTIKYECIFMQSPANVLELKAEISKYIEYYNCRRLHSTLGYKTPRFYYEQSVKLNVDKEFELYCECTPQKALQQAA
jgi:putative transposase